MTVLPSLPFVARETLACHGGNDYRGPGAWKRPRKSKKRLGTGTDVHNCLGGPLDLSRIRPDSSTLNKTNDNDNGKVNATSIGSRKRQRPMNPTISASKLSLEPLKAPVYGVGESMAVPSPSSHGPNSSATLSNVRDSSPIFAHGHGFSAKASASPSNFNQTSTGRDNSSLISRESDVEDGAAVERQDWRRSEHDLRLPKAVVKIAVDDRCNAEVLREQSFLRAISRKHAEIAMMIRERRFQASLTPKRGIGFRRRTSPSARFATIKGQRPQRRRHGRVGSAEASAGSPHVLRWVHPLTFITEAELQGIELQEMRLEDAEAAHRDKLQEARKRKDDYSAYYNLALRYRPLAEKEFRAAPYPGSVYRTKISHATRVIQNWWWCIWPALLRRRKAAALAVQSIFRGFVQRKRWREIIRLRTLWGTTRILAHAFVAWMHYAARLRRLATLTGRSRNRCLKRCLCAWAEQADFERRGKEILVRERLRRIGMGTIARVFEAWTSFAETSRTVRRMRQRSLSRPMLRVWRRRALSARRRRQLVWACSKLVSRGLRWQRRKKFLELRRACCSTQKLVRVKLTRAHFKRRIIARRNQKARKMVLNLQDDRLRLLVEDELGRRERIHSVIATRVSEAKKVARVYFQTQDDKKRTLFHCKRRVMRKLEPSSDTPADPLPESPAPSSIVLLTDSDARHEGVRSYERRERARARHDCNAQWPPHLCCAFPGCDSTFVVPSHGKRHAVDAHEGDHAAGTVELGLALSDPAMMEIFEKLLPGSKDDGRALARSSEGLVPTDLNEDNHGDMRRALIVLKTIQRWRRVPSSSPLYRELARVVLHDLPDGNFSGHGSGVFLELGHGDLGTVKESNEPDGTGFDPEVLERVCWEALVTLHAAVGEAFLRSRDYRKHVDNVEGMSEEAIAEAFSEVVRLERVQWLEEGRKLRAEALRLKTATATERMAKDAVGVVAEGDSGVLTTLIDEQVALLSVMVTAERRAFRTIISNLLDLAVNEAMDLDSREQRSLSLTVTDTLSEAATSKARSLVIDKLVDECVVELTEPRGEFWPDRGVAEAVAQGVAYRVRDQVMEEEIDAVLARLIASGEVERLASGVVAREDAGQGEHRLGSGGSAELDTGVDTTSGHRRYDCEDHVGSPYGTELGGRVEEVESVVERHGDAYADRSQQRRGPRKVDDASKREAEIDHGKKTSVLPLFIEVGHSSAVMNLPEGLLRVPGEGNTGKSDSPAVASKRVSPVEGMVPLDIVVVPSGKLASSVEESAAWNRCGGFVMTSGDNSLGKRAAILIQAAARRRAVYRSTRILVARSFAKLYDPASRAFYWYNHITGESTWEKPGIIDKYFKLQE